MLEINGFSKTYDDTNKAVNNISLSIDEGEIYGFIGHNGAGKSTTIKSIVGILPIHEGEILVGGMSVRHKTRECQKIIGYIPDNPDIYEFMSGIDYVNFVADVFSVSTEDRTKRIEYYAGLFDITEAMGDLISSYSHGMKQKISLIAAFVHKPKLLVLDEPFVGLDPKASAVLKQCMRELCDEGSAIFFSTHVLEVAEKLCDKVGMLSKGNLIVDGEVEELTKNKSLEDIFLHSMEVGHE
ncbi:MAG: ABC transporter ATP-binding protein [Lachnospiraceae bacterium]|nr:ABC transporter ATP-binding protein [Lachnospiraceae bacterium]